jgi:hypothetical protein
MDTLLDAIAEGWSWKIGSPVELIATNAFGNVIVRTADQSYFRIMPEEWSCELIARSAAELATKQNDHEFAHDWAMTRVVSLAEAAHGPLADGEVYYLVIPGVLGGKYSEDNIRKISLREVLSYSGSMARQIEDLPPGADVQIVVQK